MHRRDAHAPEHPPRRPPSRAREIVLAAALACLFTVAASPAGAAEGPPEALALVRAMAEAHGGVARWEAAPTVSFLDEFRGGTATEGQPSRVTVEQGRRRAYIDFPGTAMRMAWDGQRAWSEQWQAPYPPRFLALLNYYFLNLPWVALDPGVRLGTPGTARIPGDDTAYRTVRITYDDGVGDTPRDYYVLYIHPETHRLRATEYIVTYRDLLPEGTDTTPPHLLVFDQHTTVDGLLVPTHFTIWEGDAVYATCAIGDWSFSRPFDEARMAMPRGAVIDTSTP